MLPEQSYLCRLKKVTTIVADSGDFESARKFSPQDATTNPSLILAASKLEGYSYLIDDAIKYTKERSNCKSEAMDRLIVNFGFEYLKLIPGRISTEVDARLSYDTEGTIAKALKLIKMYEEMNISKERILIKIASTWEGIKAAYHLETEHGIHCNLTLLFSLIQARAAAEANATLISPFVGRILDWHKKNLNFLPSSEESSDDDPGVLSVIDIYNFLKYHDYSTIVMGASFRNINEIISLAGIDLLTISPTLLEELKSLTDIELKVKLSVEDAKKKLNVLPKSSYLNDKESFYKDLSSDLMADELLKSGIMKFDEDASKLESLLESQI